MASSRSGFDFMSQRPLTNVDELMKKSNLTPDLLKANRLPDSLKAKKKKEKPKVKEIPEELRTTLKILKMRSALDSKRFYKRSSMKNMSDNVQMGRVVDSPADFYSSRLTKKQRKRSLADELLADEDFTKDVKKRYVDNILTHKKKFKKDFKELQMKQRQKEKRNNRLQKSKKQKKKKKT
ncbi:Fcf2 pre-rRNA processing [Nesidiocoris tenuis]|uniref:Fcf2 pre-rRNA processing n=1 Tax=Nesidiocoris tenuis TaxID=355587 RepID=A0ABN7B9H6_9HEMI|nr:Fcf2 pre-rRNA processing [Nesidiocoris tenuis]